MLPGQRYSQIIITILAGEQGSFDIGFSPSTWIIFPTEQIQVGDFVYIAVDAQFSKTGLPITGTGQLTLPGMGGERVYLRNEGTNDVSLYVIATRGLVPPTVLTPVTIDGFTPDIYARKPFDETITGNWIFDPTTGITTFRYSGIGQSTIHIESEENRVGRIVGGTHIFGYNDAAEPEFIRYAAMQGRVLDPTAGMEYSEVQIGVIADGEFTYPVIWRGGGSSATIERDIFSKKESFGDTLYQSFWKALNSESRQATYATHWVKMESTGMDAEEGSHYFGVVINGTVTDVYRLDKDGLEILGARSVTASVLKSLIATGTPPIVVASTTLVDNLNADLLDGVHGLDYLDSDNFFGVEWADLTDLGQTTLHSHSLEPHSHPLELHTHPLELHSHPGGNGGAGVLEVQVFS